MNVEVHLTYTIEYPRSLIIDVYQVKRSYWSKRLVPDGHVQRRINNFTAIVPTLGVGGGGNGGDGVAQISASSVGCTTGRKRKFVDQETRAAK